VLRKREGCAGGKGLHMPFVILVKLSECTVHQSYIAFCQVVQSLANQQGGGGLCSNKEVSDDLLLRLLDCCAEQCSGASFTTSWEAMFGSTSVMSIGQLPRRGRLSRVIGNHTHSFAHRN
jgi:hypothetical protein